MLSGFTERSGGDAQRHRREARRASLAGASESNALQLLFGQELSQHEWQNPAVAIIIDLDGRIDAKLHWH